VGDELSYIGLFAGCFLSATIIPFASEAFVIAMFLGGFDPWMVVLVAGLGNWLGGMTNYGLGVLLDFHHLEKWFKLNPAKLEKFRNWVNRYGVWTALISWLPVLGDPLTLALGVFRVNVWWVAILSFTGKIVRYIVMALIYVYS